MDSLHFNLDMMAKETFDLAQKLQSSNPFHHFEKDPQLDLHFSQKMYSTGPGLLYHIENGLNTFCIRGLACDNINQTVCLLRKGNPQLEAILKLENKNIDDLQFFETKTYELAEVISDQIVNLRFPRQEDLLCNLSDPGFSWWFRPIEDGLHLYFKSFGHANDQGFMKLGPIGDKKVAATRFSQAQELLSHFFPISEYSCSDKELIIKTSNVFHPHFKIFKDIFLQGRNPTRQEFFPDNRLSKTLFFYFHEIAVLRAFWLQVEAALYEGQSLQ